MRFPDPFGDLAKKHQNGSCKCRLIEIEGKHHRACQVPGTEESVNLAAVIKQAKWEAKFMKRRMSL